MLEYDIVAKVLNRTGTLWKDCHSNRLMKCGFIRKSKTAQEKAHIIWYRNSQAVRGRKKVSQSHIVWLVLLHKHSHLHIKGSHIMTQLTESSLLFLKSNHSATARATCSVISFISIIFDYVFSWRKYKGEWKVFNLKNVLKLVERGKITQSNLILTKWTLWYL